MKNRFNYRKFNYGIFLYLPLLLPMVFFLQAVILNIFISLIDSKSYGSPVYSIAFLAGLIFVPYIINTIGYNLCRKFLSIKSRFFINFLTWNILALITMHLILTSLGGVSMAVVEGVTSAAELRLQALYQTLKIMPFLQVFIVPWVYFVTVKTVKYFSFNSKLDATVA